MSWPGVSFLNLSLHAGCCLCRHPVSSSRNLYACRRPGPSLVRLPRFSGVVARCLPWPCLGGGLPSAVASLCLLLPRGWGPLPSPSSRSRGSLSLLYDCPYPSHIVCSLLSHGTLFLPCLWLILHSYLVFRGISIYVSFHLQPFPKLLWGQGLLMHFLISLLSSIMLYMWLTTHQVLNERVYYTHCTL